MKKRPEATAIPELPILRGEGSLEINRTHSIVPIAESFLGPGESLYFLTLPEYLEKALSLWVTREVGGGVYKGTRECGIIKLFTRPRPLFSGLFQVGNVVFSEGAFEARICTYSTIPSGDLDDLHLGLVFNVGCPPSFKDATIAYIWTEVSKMADDINKAFSPRPTGEALPGLFLNEGIKESLLGDIQSFLDSADLCRELNIPWRRGYLLYGPPGNGKSRTIRQIAEHFNFSIKDVTSRMDQGGMLHFQTESPHIWGTQDDKALHEEFTRCPVLSVGVPEHLLSTETMMRLLSLRRPEVFYIEDLDKFVAFQSSDGNRDASRISLHDLLKAIDGVEGAVGTMIFMTTNHPDQLAESLVRRPGRIDRIFRIDLPTEAQIGSLLRHFNYESEKPLEDVAKELHKQQASMAFAEELVRTLRMRYRRSRFSRQEVEEEIKVIVSHLSLTDPVKPKWSGKKGKVAGFSAIEEV
jgi:hypothetical protein